jgi:hypothetical protein
VTAFRSPFGEDLACARVGRGELESDDPRPARVFQSFLKDQERDDGERDHRDTEEDQPLLPGHQQLGDWGACSVPGDAPHRVCDEYQDEYEAQWREVGGADVGDEHSEDPGDYAKEDSCS